MNAKELFRDAQRFFVEGRHKESIEAFGKSIEAGERTEIAFLSRGVAYLKTEDTDRAIEDFSTVIGMNDRNFRAYFYRGTAYMRKEDFRSAIADFDRTIELKPDHGAAFFARGTAYAQTGNEYEASRNLKTAMTFSEAMIQSFADHYGMFRTQFDKALAFMTGGDIPPSMSLTREEIKTLKKWLDEENGYH